MLKWDTEQRTPAEQLVVVESRTGVSGLWAQRQNTTEDKFSDGNRFFPLVFLLHFSVLNRPWLYPSSTVLINTVLVMNTPLTVTPTIVNSWNMFFSPVFVTLTTGSQPSNILAFLMSGLRLCGSSWASGRNWIWLWLTGNISHKTIRTERTEMLTYIQEVHFNNSTALQRILLETTSKVLKSKNDTSPTRLLMRRANSRMVCSSGFPCKHD